MTETMSMLNPSETRNHVGQYNEETESDRTVNRLNLMMNKFEQIMGRIEQLEKTQVGPATLSSVPTDIEFKYYFNSQDLNLYERFCEKVEPSRALSIILKILSADRNTKWAWISRLEEHQILSPSEMPILIKRKTKDTNQELYIYTEKGKPPLIDRDGSLFERLSDNILSDSIMWAMNKHMDKVLKQNEEDDLRKERVSDREQAKIDEAYEHRISELLDSLKYMQSNVFELLLKYRKLKPTDKHAKVYYSLFRQVKV